MSNETLDHIMTLKNAVHRVLEADRPTRTHDLHNLCDLTSSKTRGSVGRGEYLAKVSKAMQLHCVHIR